ncbi:MAG: phytoene desaturase family protein [Chloroflexota bacterium]|nr:phytoene desaturase family protein [Chloroflexota bacterium]
MSATRPDPIVVIGAGIGGLSAAIRLAAAGRRIVVYEAAAQVGGKMNEIAADGFRWDTGPSVITMRPVLESLFADAGRRLDDYLTLLPVDPLTRYFWRDGTTFDAARDLTHTVEQITAIEPRDVEGYLAYLAYAARIHRITGEKFIYGDPPTPLKLLNTAPLDMLAVDPLRTMHGAIASFVRSPKLRQFLGRFATYVGASPYRAPATLNVIAHVELTGGVWVPRGGIYAIARALEKLADELGVEIHLSAPIASIAVEDDRVCGVVLADGTRVRASAVIANVDVATVYDRLLPASPARAARHRQLMNAEASCSGFVLLLGVEGVEARLAHHNIFFSDDYRREFDDIFARGVPPDDPTVYAAITAKTDPDHAPPGCENWFVLVNAPPLDARFDWTTGAPAYRDRVLARLAEHGCDLRGRIRSETMLTPIDLERLTGARRGALYGMGSNDRLSAFRRPHNRDPQVRGLYFAGGTAHPGGGVPMVILSGKAAAGMVMRDETMRGSDA